jgi:hypothetical protein
MKRLGYMVFILIMFVFTVSPLAAQVNFDDFKSDFQNFSDAVASSLPFNAAVGLQWSDAYIGNFPHFGVGATLGTTFIPWDAAKDVADTFGIDFGSLYPGLVENMGMPLPAWSVEGRIGGLGFPFDIGVKIGYLPKEAAVLLPKDMTFDYLLVGADFRYGILEDSVATPALSVGVGVNYMSGNITYHGVTGGDQTIDVSSYGLSFNNFTLTDPDVTFFWHALSIDIKAQLSKNLLFITPYIGAAASYTVYADAGGGLSSEILVGVNPITPSQINELESLGIDASSKEVTVSSSANGWGLRAFGGVAFNLLIIKIDLHAMYNILNSALGFSVNVRAQL